MDNRERIETLLRGTNRDGIEELITWMNDNDFYGTPCSTKYHLCQEGGLAIHSINVYEAMLKLRDSLGMTDQISDESVVICSLLHDLGKCGDFDKCYYIPNILKSGKQSEAEPYKTNSNLQSIDHEIRSVMIANRFINLTEDESMAILYHNGLYGKLMSGFSHPNETPIMLLTHWADMWASRYMEVND